MKRSTYPFSLSALLLASSVIAVPLDLSADAEKLTPRAPPVCTTDRTLIDPLCWDTLKIGDYLTSWGKTTPKCADTGRTGVKCCTSTESWSTCFLRLATGSPGYKCDDMSPAFCGNTPQLTLSLGNDFKLTAILRSFKADDFRKFSGAAVLSYNLPVPGTLGLSIANITGQGNNSLGVAALWSAALDSAPAVKKLLWDRPAENSQQLPLLFASPPEDSASSLLTDALKLILSDIPTFLAFAGEGRFTTDSYPNVPLDPGFDLGTGLHTFVTSKLMQMNNYYAVPMDVVTDEMATKTAAENTDAVYHWSRNTHRLYELRAKGKPVIDKATLYEEHLMNNDWADAQLLFDGSYNCTAVGNAGGAIVHLPNNVTDVSCVSQLPMYLPKNSPCPTPIQVGGKCPFGYLG
ncbi:MAG: hypothetical protein LQ346_007364 [Caloplaca aetnensis]|nr:MAG: hypothetical protein LQ346_007364 [Caloplaca aetnensis]